MSRSVWAVVARHLEAVAHTGTLAACSDAQLLDRFRRHRDEAAFGALVQAHGPMVRAVCRRIVADPHAADDAFQATFLVLARRAGSVRDADRLGPWLHRVAVRVATRADREARRQRTREVADPVALELAIAPEPDGPDPDRARLLHEELDRLPDRYRLPVLLCDLQRLTHEEAARRLGWPVGTVKGRQARARDRLRDRLTRRGLVAPAGLITASLASDARAVLPAALAAQTANVALNALTGASAAVTATAAALALARGVRPTMWFAPLKLTAVAALLGGGLIATQAVGPGPAPAARPQAPAGAGARAGSGAAPAPAADPLVGAPATGGLQGRGGGGGGLQGAGAVGGFGGGGGGLQGAGASGGFGGGGGGGLQGSALGGEGAAAAGLMAAPGTAPITPQEREALIDQREQSEVEEDLLADELAMVRESITDLARKLRQNRMTILQNADVPDDGQAQKRWEQVMTALSHELDRQRAEYAKGLAQQREQRRLRADLERRLQAPSTEPERFKPGDILVVEVLQALPGRPISGERIVRPDGTLSLGFYGDIRVAGLTSREVKEAVIAHLRKHLTDEALGLESQDEQGKNVPIAPADSDRVFVDEAGWSGSSRAAGETRIRDLERKLDRMQQELRRLRPSDARPAADPS